MVKDNSITVKIKVDKRSIDSINAFAKAALTAQEVANKLIASFQGEKTDPEIRIIDTAALPASYFMSEDVIELVKANIVKEYKSTGNLPRGVELIGEEATNGETKEISDPTIDSTSGDDGPTTPGDSGDNASQTGGSGPDNPGDATSESPNDGSGGDQESGGGK